MDIDFTKLLQIALNEYNSANSTSYTMDSAARAIVLALETLIATNIANASTVTNPI